MAPARPMTASRLPCWSTSQEVAAVLEGLDFLIALSKGLPAALPIPGTLCHNPRPTTCRGALASRAVGAASDEMAGSDVSP